MLEEKNPSIAVLLPCYNEEVTIGKVVRDFRVALPDAAIYAVSYTHLTLPTTPYV